MAGAAVVGGYLNIGALESARWEELCSCARALQHHDGAAALDQGLNDAWKYRDAQTTGDADGRPRRLQLKAASEGAEQIHFVTLVENREPRASGADHVKDEPDQSTRRIRPGCAVRSTEDRVRGADCELKELAGSDRGRRGGVGKHKLNGPGHWSRALDHDRRRNGDAHARTTSGATAPTYSPSVATLDRCSRRDARSACTRALAVSSEVRQGMRRSTEARRISYPSRNGTPAPWSTSGADADTVFITRCTWPEWITSTMFG